MNTADSSASTPETNATQTPQTGLYNLSGRTAIVTGAVDGIGWASALLLAERGANVCVIGRTEDQRLQARRKELEALGSNNLAIAADNTKDEEIKAAYSQIRSKYKTVDILVANAGRLGDGPLRMISEELLCETIDINLTGTIRHLRSCSPLMRKSVGGSIVIIGSIMGLAGNAFQVPYSAAKAGLVGVMRSASKELAAQKTRVNLVAPGFIDTPLTSDLDTDIRDERVDSTLLNRGGTPREVAELVAFLASDASSYITGQSVGIDGGMVI